MQFDWDVERNGHRFRVRCTEDGTRSGEYWTVFNGFGQAISIFSDTGAAVIAAVREAGKP